MTTRPPNCLRALLGVVWLGAACAAAKRPQVEANPMPGEDVVAMVAEQMRIASELEGLAAAESAKPDCPRAEKLRDQICDLAKRICVIAKRHPEDPDLAVHCRDAETRCAKARKAVAARCPDPAAPPAAPPPPAP